MFPQKPKNNKIEDIDPALGNGLRGLPECLGHFHRKSCGKHFSKIRSRNVKNNGIGHAQYFHSLPEGPKLRSVCRTKRQGLLDTRRTGNHVFRAAKFGDLTTMQSWCKIWLLNGCNHCRAKPNLLKSSRKFLALSEKPRVIEIVNSMELVKILRRIIFESLYIYASPFRDKWYC